MLKIAVLAAFVLVQVRASADETAESTSLFIPGFDPQPLSVSELGVDAAGHTTWALYMDGGDAGPDDGNIGTPYIVEGSDFAAVSFPALSTGIACSLSAGSLAICSDGNAADGVATETLTPLAVAVIAATTTASATATSTADNNGTASGTGTTSASQPAQTGSGGAPTLGISMGLAALAGVVALGAQVA